MPVPLIVVTAVLMLIVCLLQIRLHLILVYDGEIRVRFRYAFVTIRMKLRGAGKAKKVSVETKKEEKKISVRQMLRLFDRFSRYIRDATRATIKRLRIDRLRIRLIICEEDAASTAIAFGAACAGIYGGVAAIGNLVPIRERDITIRPLYNGEKSEAAFECSLSMRLGGMLAVGLTQAAVFLRDIIRQNLSHRAVKDGAVK